MVFSYVRARVIKEHDLGLGLCREPLNTIDVVIKYRVRGLANMFIAFLHWGGGRANGHVASTCTIVNLLDCLGAPQVPKSHPVDMR
jgi:hypothetical protein